MHGTGVAIVTPFTAGGDVDGDALATLVVALEDRGVDFVVPVGSTGESVLLTEAEQTRVIEAVCDAASVPVLAGTGQPGLEGTVEATARAAAAGADAAMVVTPYYFDHGQDALAAYYRELADAAELPVYAYSIPSRTGVALAPETVAEIAAHPNVVGLKDSSGDLGRFTRTAARVDDGFDLLVGHGGLYAPALELGAAGGILALANVAPEAACTVYARYDEGDERGARELNAELAELNWAVTAGYGVAGLKAAMRYRGLPAGHVRSPHRPVGPEAETELARLVDAAVEGP
jgi:4-hydroxy-tetrahydrodipicolinate synthase